MDPVWQDVLFGAFATVWLGSTVVLYLLLLKRQLNYLRRFPPVDGVPLAALRPDNPFGARQRAIWRAHLQWQPDPELERMRLDLWSRYAFLALWIFGFPVLCLVLIFAVALLRLVVRSL